MLGSRATRILTPAEWATFPAQREQARRARMMEEKISFAELARGRAWWLAPEPAEGPGPKPWPDFEDDSGNDTYAYMLHLDAAAARELHQAAAAEIVALIKARKLRFVRDGKNVSSKLNSW